ncbi:MAG: M13 family metallopeptidase, partial [Bacteroidota bacterium]
MKSKIYTLLIVILAMSCIGKVQNLAIDPANLNTDVKPGDNFYLYANGGWLENNPLPDDRSRYGSFDQLADSARKQVRKLIRQTAKQNNEPGSAAQQTGDFYASGMDMDARNKAGLNPLKKELKRIEKAKNNQAVFNVIAHMHRDGLSALFTLYGTADAKNSQMVRTHLMQGGLGLPNRDYYTDNDKRTVSVRQKYEAHIAKMMMLAGESESDAITKAESILKLETRLAENSMTPLEMRDPHKLYNKMDLNELKELAPEVSWNYYFENLGIGNPEVIIVGQPEFFREVNAMLKDIPTKTWKSYLKWNLLNSTASYLSDEFSKQNFNFYGRVLSGTEKQRPLWKRVQDVTSGSLTEALGKVYVEEYFPPEAKERMLDLVSNLKVALNERINQTSWMSEETKSKAQQKLETMNVKIGYPDKWRDYSGLEISKQPFVRNVLAAQAFNRQYNLNKINKPVDPDEWHMPPQMVNAYYSPSKNEIVFPAAILQPPFFFMDADDAVNYGAIGVVIGHEMTHGFDDKGRQYDKEGNLQDWWTKKDAENFDKRAQVLVKQFNQYRVLDTLRADGELSLGENIADLGGLNIALTAFNKTEQAQSDEKIAGFTPQQRFFLSYAHIWAQNIRDEEIVKRTRED